MIDKTDKLTKLSNRLKEVKEKFEALKKSGVDKELLNVWIQHKTKLSKGNVIKMIEAQEDFYTRLVKESIIEKLGDNE